MIWGALKADGRLAAKNAVKIRAALHQVTDFKLVFNKYQETHPQPTDNPAQDRTRARSWIMLNVYLNDEPMKASVMQAWAEAYVLGQAAADEWIRKAVELKKADDIEVNWDNWKPGDKATALLLKPTKGFTSYLQSVGADSYFKKFNKETVVNLGTALSDSIELGLDAESAAVMIAKHVASSSRALTIAITEQNRAMSFGSIQRYKEAELTKMEWAVSDPCDVCAQNDGQVIVIGEAFASGDRQPPAHPHCRCVLLPVIPGMEEEDPMGIDGGITNPTIDDGVLVNEPVSTEYRGYHRAPSRADDFGSPATDIEEMMPDFYARPNIYTTGMDQSDKESVAALLAIRNKPDALVTIYRAVPKDVKQINAGDWVTLSPSYADSHLLSNLEEGHVIKKKIPARDLWFDGDSINEFGYDPVDVPKIVPKAEYVPAKNSMSYYTPQRSLDLYPMGKNGPDYDAFDRNGQNLYLKNLLQTQGFNGKPRVVSAEEFETYLKQKSVPIYRGVSAANAEKVDEFVDQLMFGDSPFVGKGYYADGTYFANNKEIAEGYATHNAKGEIVPFGKVTEAVLDPNAKVISLEEITKMRTKYNEEHGYFSELGYAEDFASIDAFAAANGYDAIKITNPNIVGKITEADYYVVLNRTALIMKEMP